MTLDSMISMLDDLLSYDLDNVKRRDGHTVTSEEKTAQINYGLRTISRYIYQFDPSIPLTLTADKGTVDLRDPAQVGRKVLEAKQVIVGGVALRRRDGKRGLWGISDIERYRGNWRYDDSGTPTAAWQIGETLYLHQKPSASVALGSGHCIAATYLADDLVYGENAAPDLPEELHEAAVRIAAVFASDPTLSEAESLSRSMRYESRAMSAAKEIRIRNYKQVSAFLSEPGQNRSEVRYVG